MARRRPLQFRDARMRRCFWAGWVVILLSIFIGQLEPPPTQRGYREGLERLVPSMFYDERVAWFAGGLLLALVIWLQVALSAAQTADWQTILSDPWGLEARRRRKDRLAAKKRGR